jgi:hypothetical protein
VTLLLRHLQRRALVVLTWLVLALSVAPAANAEPVRAHAALLSVAVGYAGATPVGRAGVVRAPIARADAGPSGRGLAASELVARVAPEAAFAGSRGSVAASASHRPCRGGGRRLYLENCSFLW